MLIRCFYLLYGFVEYANFMQKNEMKNFICSFFLSLLAVGAVGKGLFYTPEQSDLTASEKNIPAKHISLFREKINNDPVNIKPENENAEKIDISAIEALTAKEDTPQTVKTQDLAFEEHPLPILELTPAESGIAAASETPVSQEYAFNTDISSSKEISLEALDGQSDNNMDISSAVVALSSLTSNDNHSAPAIIYTPEANETPVEDQIVIAAAEPQTEVSDSIIPIEESSETLYQSIDVMSSANASQIAMLEPNNLIQNIDVYEETKSEAETIDEADLKQSQWQQMSSETTDSPWVIAKGNKFAKNQAVVEQFADAKIPAEPSASEPSEQPLAEESAPEGEKAISEQSAEELRSAVNPEPLLRPIEQETKLAYQMIENLLIPIPEDIKNDADLTPDLSVTPRDKPRENKISVQQQPQAPVQTPATAQNEELSDKDKEDGLFKNIASWFSSKPEDQKTKDDKASAKKQKKKKKGGLDMTFFQNLGTDDSDEDQHTIMPAELRLSFQPNRAEISGQTLRWIHAFADNARDNDGVYIEIRIDGTSTFALQQKRLNLLSTILANRGVDFRKINIVFTSREPNSFIIRNVRFGNDRDQRPKQNRNDPYYQHW